MSAPRPLELNKLAKDVGHPWEVLAHVPDQVLSRQAVFIHLPVLSDPTKARSAVDLTTECRSSGLLAHAEELGGAATETSRAKCRLSRPYKCDISQNSLKSA